MNAALYKKYINPFIHGLPNVDTNGKVGQVCPFKYFLDTALNEEGVG